MPILTFRDLIARNRRNSALLILLFVLFFVGVGLLIGLVWGGDWHFGAVVAGIAAAVAFLLTLASYYGGSSALLAMSQAHEIIHVRHRDILFGMLMAVMVGVLVMLCDVFLRSLWWGGGRRGRSSRRSQGGGAAQIILVVIALVLAIIAPILARIIHMAMSRQREYLADAGAVELTRNPTGLAGALAKLAGDTEVLEVANRATAPLYIVHPIKKFEARASSIFSTHPPIQDRIQRLLSLTV
jgi:Zn-dependent protease with chaperone function